MRHHFIIFLLIAIVVLSGVFYTTRKTVGKDNSVPVPAILKGGIGDRSEALRDDDGDGYENWLEQILDTDPKKFNTPEEILERNREIVIEKTGTKSYFDEAIINYGNEFINAQLSNTLTGEKREEITEDFTARVFDISRKIYQPELTLVDDTPETRKTFLMNLGEGLILLGEAPTKKDVVKELDASITKFEGAPTPRNVEKDYSEFISHIAYIREIEKEDAGSIQNDSFFVILSYIFIHENLQIILTELDAVLP